MKHIQYHKGFEITQSSFEGFVSFWVVNVITGEDIKNCSSKQRCIDWIDEKNPNQPEEKKMKVAQVPISKINILENVRVSIKDIHLKELMSSIRQHGLEQPIGVGKNKDGSYVLIYGHRRLVACKKLGWKTISCVVDDAPNLKDQLILNMVENLQRQDVSPDELGRLCCRLQEMELTTGEIAARLNIPESKIKNAIRIFRTVPEKIRSRVKFMPAGRGGKVGDISATTVNRIISARKEAHITQSQFESLLNTARVDELSSADLDIIIQLIKRGMVPNAAVKEAKNYSVYKVMVVARKDEVELLSKKVGATSARQYLSGICYGENKTIKRPIFLKNGGGK